jgi:hypothetical protein
MPDANSTAVSIRNFIGYPPLSAALFGRYLDLRRKKPARASQVQPIRAAARRRRGSCRTRSGRRSKPSINHEGKETNRLAASGSMRRRSNRQSKPMENFIGRRERAPAAELSASH